MDFWDLKGQDFGNQFEATEVELLEKNVRTNPRDFENYEKLLNSYQKMGEIEKLRDGRMEMAKFLLIPPTTWVEWMEEEILAEEYELYEQLFEKAVQQYPDHKIWTERLKRVIKMVIDEDGDVDHDNLEVAREMFELAIKACGHFIVGGSDIWQLYRNLETTVLSKSLTTMDDEEEMDDLDVPQEAKDQIEKVKNLYCRQLEFPLINISDVYNEYNEWHTKMYDVVSHDMKETYGKVFKYLKSVALHEDALQEEGTSTEEREALWTQYIREQIKKETDISRVQSIFERAIIDCVEAPGNLWTHYVQYAIRYPLVSRLQICDRAVKAHPKNGKLWGYFLTATGKDEKSINRVLEVWKTASSCKLEGGSLDLSVALISYYRKFAADKIQEALQLAEKLLAEASDHIRSRFYRFWGQVACVSLKDVSLTRQAYEKYRRSTKKLAKHWIESVDALVLVGDIPGARSLFKQALRLLSAEDGFFDLKDRWLLFEQIHGGREEFIDAQWKIEFQEKKVRAEQERKKASMKGKSKKRRLEEAALNAKKRAKLNSGKPAQRTEEKGDVEMSSADNTKSNADAPPGFNEDNGPPGFNDDAPPGFTDSAPPGFNESAPPGFEEDGPPGFKEDPPPKVQKAKESTPPAEKAEETKMQIRTIFVLNIPKALRYEQELEKLCQQFGEVKSVRCPRGQKGKTLKGFGYVEFAEPEDAAKALKGLVGKNLGKKQLQIQKYRKASGSGNTLFIKGIKKLKNPSFQLKKLFESCGNIVEIRVPLDNTKRNKGFAYVEFEKAKGVEAALKLENPTIEGFTLGVQRCKDKKKAAKDLPKQFVPRTLNRSKKKALGTSSSASGAKPKDATAEAPASASSKEATTGNLSNNDFRNMLLSK